MEARLRAKKVKEGETKSKKAALSQGGFVWERGCDFQRHWVIMHEPDGGGVAIKLSFLKPLRLSKRHRRDRELSGRAILL